MHTRAPFATWETPVVCDLVIREEAGKKTHKAVCCVGIPFSKAPCVSRRK